jgi:hypothetical protein
MNPWITLSKFVVLSLFIVTASGVTVYDLIYIQPAKRCERAGAWWDARDRQCLTPIPIWWLTGRGLPNPPHPAAGGATQRVAPGVQSTSPPALALANRAATKSRSDSRFK